MKLDSLSNNGFILSNDLHRVECNFQNSHVAILKNNELTDYCKLVFPYSYTVSNLVCIVNVVTNEILFEVDLKGSDTNVWNNQLIQAFADYLNDSDVIIGYYNIDGVKIVKVL